MKLLALYAALALALAGVERPGRKWTTIQRTEIERLKAVHEARERFARERTSVPRHGVYEDIRAVLHIHAEDAEHTRGTRAQALEAAKKTGVQVVMLTDHRGPKPETWHGMRDGVLFLSGSEDDHLIRFPAAGEEDLRFLSHPEERMQMPARGFAGMEIYNRHADANDETDFHDFFQLSATVPGEWKRLTAAYRAYPDEFFAVEADYWPQLLARFDQESARRRFTAIAANDAHQNQFHGGVQFDSYEVAFRNVSTHVLARELTEAAIRRSLREGRAYVAHDWLADPTGFLFIARNNLGVFEMGDTAPMAGTTRVGAQLPLAAQVKLFRNGTMVHEETGARVAYAAKEPGAYRVEAWLAVDGEERPWIYSNPIYLEAPPVGALAMPPRDLAPSVEAIKDLVYTSGKPEDEAKHRLDIYRRKDAKAAPVLLFIHGGSWRSGDRSVYPAVANRFAKEGVVTVVISYRLAPVNRHPAQVEDAAAAFAWVLKNIAQYGGDPKRIYVAGHSAGAHLASLLALDPRYLKAHDLTPAAIRGVASLSGPYEIGGQEAVFGRDAEVLREASPMTHVRSPAPPFLIGYCQWDYLMLPMQARRFHEALRQAGVEAELLYVPGEGHISEMVHVVKDDDATALAVLRFVKR